MNFDLEMLSAQMELASMEPTVRLMYRSLFRYAYTGNLSPIEELVKVIDQYEGYLENALRVTDEDGMSALHFAAAGGRKNVAQYLMETGKVDINIKDKKAGETPLHHAILNGRFPMAVFLLQNGADPNVRTKKRRTALHYAVEHGSTKLVQLLISKGADVNAVAADIGTPLHCAAEKGKSELVKLLLEHHADPNAKSLGLRSPLLAAIHGQSLECMELLIKAGADPNSGSSKGMTPLGYAASEGGLKEIYSFLLKHGANQNAKDLLEMTPVEKAAWSNKRRVVRILFPLTSPIPSIPQWTISGLFEQVHSDNYMLEKELKAKEVALNLKSKGDECFNQKDYLGAVQYHSQALEFNPQDYDVLYVRSQSWGMMGEGGLALEDAEACINLAPNWSYAYHLAGSARMLLREYKMAATAFESGLKLDPESTMLQHALRDATEARNRQYLIFTPNEGTEVVKN